MNDHSVTTGQIVHRKLVAVQTSAMQTNTLLSQQSQMASLLLLHSLDAELAISHTHTHRDYATATYTMEMVYFVPTTQTVMWV